MKRLFHQFTLTLSDVLLLAMSIFMCMLFFGITNNVILTIFMLIFLMILGYKSYSKEYQDENECILDSIIILGLVILSMFFPKLNIIDVTIISLIIFGLIIFDLPTTDDDILSLMIVLTLVVLVKILGAQSFIFILMLYGFKMIYA